MSVDRQEPEMQLIWAPTIIISPTQPVAIGQPRQLQVSLKLTVCFTFSGFLRILIGILHQKNFYCLNSILNSIVSYFGFYLWGVVKLGLVKGA